jgi:hypothetical protein
MDKVGLHPLTERKIAYRQGFGLTPLVERKIHGINPLEETKIKD